MEAKGKSAGFSSLLAQRGAAAADAGAGRAFWTAERISNLALPTNQTTRAASVTLQPGSTVFQGTVAPQLNFGPNLTGGAAQTYNALGPRAIFKELP